jgi:hypothetical protein
MNICHWHVKGLILQQETGGASRSATSGVVSDAKPIATATDLRRVFTIDEFCDAYHLSRSFYYRLRHMGKGPCEIRLGRKAVITMGDARAW